MHYVILTLFFLKNSPNDSGYGTPKHSPEFSCEKINFEVENPSNHGSSTVIANKDDSLAAALKQQFPKMMKNIKNMLFWGEIRSHSGTKCINPFLLPCGFIQRGSTIQIEEASETVYDYSMPLEATKPYSKLQCSVFFISIEKRKRKRAITKVHYRDLRCHDICVFATPFQTYEKALIADQRFINVKTFTLKRKKKEGGADIAIDLKPADLPEELVLEVTVTKTEQAESLKTTSHKSTNPMASTSTATTNDANTAEKSIRESPKRKKNLNELTDKLWEKNAVYVFSKDTNNLTSEEMFSEMDDCLRARARCTLIGSKDRKGRKYDKSIKKIASIEFANHSVIARPIRITRTLVELSASIGFLKCGSVTATCFLVRNNMIVTNYHVLTKILSARDSSTPYDHSDVFVNFDHEDIPEPLFGRHKLRSFPDPDSENLMSESLDYAFLYLENSVDGRPELGAFVQCKVPEQGSVCIVGHPNGEEKKEELCAILPLHEDRRALELERRIAENCHQYQNSPSAAALFMYCSNIRRLYGDKATLTYDVNSMFEGSSGAPVFDMKCNIVALHTRGFRLEQTSIVEVGITFDTIIRDLRARGLSDFVSENFQCCPVEEFVDDEDMDTN